MLHRCDASGDEIKEKCMKVKILQRDGSIYPIAFCQVCDKPIDGSEPAECLIPEIAEGEYGIPLVGHYRCTIKVEKGAPRGVIYGNQSIGHLLMCLVHNTKTNLKAEQRRNEEMNSISW